MSCPQRRCRSGFTFTSDADQAWITDEIGTDRAAKVFVRAQQFELGGKITGTVTAGALGQVAGGPPLGALGRTSLRGALPVSGLIWLPIPLLYLRLRAPADVSGKNPAPGAV